MRVGIINLSQFHYHFHESCGCVGVESGDCTAVHCSLITDTHRITRDRILELYELAHVLYH